MTVGKRQDPGHTFFQMVAEVLKAMADPVRLRILHSLQAEDRCVGSLVEELDCSQANVSKHLGVLKRAGLVHVRREGLNMVYSIADAAVFDICDSVGRSIEERLSTERKEIRMTRRQFQAGQGG